MARKRKNSDEKKVIYVFLEGVSEEIYFKNIKREYGSKLAKFELFRATNGGSDVFNHIKTIVKKNRIYLSEVDQIWIVFDTEKELKSKWDEYRKIVKTELKDLKDLKHLKKVKLLMTSKAIEYFFILHYDYTQPNDYNIDFKKRLKKYQENYTKTDEEIIRDIYSNKDKAIENSKKTVMKILEGREYKNIFKSDYEFYKTFFYTDCSFSLIFQAFEYLDSL